MPDFSDSRTSVSLLERLGRPGEPDQVAWADFVAGYGPKVRQWCLRWGLQEADAEDVSQMVLLKLAARMKEFHYDPARSFRAWLKTIAQHAWSDFVEARQRAGQVLDNSEALARLESAEARDELSQRLEEQYERELLEQAMEIVRPQTVPNNWEAFRLTALEGVPAKEAARRLGLKIAQVYTARSRVQKRLQEECRKREGGTG